MSRNDQVTRQWLILQALERTGGATIEEIARSLPEDYACHARTIRRDLQALEVRFPIYTDRADGQVRWKFVEGFNPVPSVQFSATELMALIFTRDLARPLEGTPIKDSLDSALAKASAWAKDRIWHASQKAAVDSKGCLTLTLRVADTPELEGWILSFGSGVRVLRPASLRERIVSAASEIVARN